MLHLSGVVELQSMETVIGPLNEGFVFMCNTCKLLLEAEVDSTTGMSSNYEQIRQQIIYAEQCLKKSDAIIQEKLQRLDEQMEKLIKEDNNAEQQKKKKQMAMIKLQIQKKSAEESLKCSKEALEQAEKSLEMAKHVLREQEARRSTGQGVAIAGAALTVIPIFGWIAGLIMVPVGITEISKASSAIRDAEDEQKKSQTTVETNRTKVSDYQSKIAKTESEIKETDELLKKIQSEMEAVKQHLDYTADFQEMVRKAVNLLSIVSGRVTVLERQTRRFILWEPVIKVMEEVMKAVANVAENRLLYNHDVAGLMNTLRENVGGMLALCSPPTHSEHEDYY